jgi:hypothetical protein
MRCVLSIGALTKTARILKFGLLILLGALSAACSQASAQSSKPNIMFIMGDAIGWMQVGAYQDGLGLDSTPNLDRIAREGAR